MSDAVLQFLIANLALSGGIVMVFVLRRAVRMQFGARVGYALWVLPLLAAGASFLPPRVVEIMAPAVVAPVFEAVAPTVAPTVAPVVTVMAAPVVAVDPWMVGGLVWIMGMVAMAAWLAAVQMRFMAGVRRGEAGPAVVGFLRPRIVTPTDFEVRYDAGERRVILTHETIHLDRNDARINALAALIRCVCWFNPLVHLAAHFLRIDQELACDAAVVERHPKARKLYADALLKTQLAAHPLPLGCYWPAGTEHPLMERIEMLKQHGPGIVRRTAGLAVLALIAIVASCTTWAVKPAETRFVETPAQQDALRLLAPPPEPSQASADQPLRIVAIKRGLLNVHSARGDKYVHRFFEKGESYLLRVGYGWTVSADDGSAFEWRLGDRSLGLLAAAGGPVQKQSVDLVLTRTQGVDRPLGPDQASNQPQPIVYEPQPPPAPTARPLAVPTGFDASDPIHLLGKVEKIDFGATTYVAFVRAASIAACPQGPEKVNTALWELAPTPYWGDRDAVIKDLMNAGVYVRGFNAKDKSCAPNCKMLARGVFKSRNKLSVSAASIGAFTDRALTCTPAPQPARYEPPAEPQAPPAEPAVYGEPSLFEIRADRGRYDEPSKTRIYEGNVEIRFDGGLFTTDRLVVEDGAAPARASSTILSPRISIGAPSPIKVNADRSDQDPQSGTVVYSGNVELRGANVLLKADRLTLELVEALTPISAPEPQKLPAPEEQPAKKPSLEDGAVKGPSKTEEEIIERKKSEVEGADLKRQALKSKAEVEQAELKRQAMKSKAEEALRGGKAELRKIETPKDRELMDKLRSSGEADELRKAEAIEKLRKAEETGQLLEKAPPPPYPGWKPFAATFDADAPLMITGAITKVEPRDAVVVFWVKAASVSPASTTGAEPGTVWRVDGPRMDIAPPALKSLAPGQVVTVRGYNAKDASCSPECQMAGRDVTISRAN